MGVPDGGVEIDAEALHRAADLLAGAEGPLTDLGVATGAAQGDAAAAAGPVALSTALAELRDRWDSALTATARRIGESGALLQSGVAAHEAVDDAGARDVSPPPR